MPARAASERFGKVCRVRKSKEYQYVTKKGRRLSLPHFVISYSLVTTDNSRLGLIVSRKVGNAVARNRIKRLLREFFRHQRPHLVTLVDLVILARPGSAQLSSADLFLELRQGLLRAALLRETP